MSAAGRARSAQFGVPIAKPKKLGQETLAWYWHPYRAGVRTAPEWFKDQLDRFDPELAVTWTPIQERWLVWCRAPRLVNPICSGWRLLFVHNGPAGEYLPLDERLFARVESASARVHGDGKRYMQRIIAEMERDEAKREADRRQDAVDRAMPIWDHTRIRVGYGKSSGSKFSKYHA